MNEALYRELNKSWKTTCRILLGQEIGDLKDYSEWLKEHPEKIAKRTSVSGEEVSLARDVYCEDARFVPLDNVSEKMVDPLTINQVKDIDSILDAISENWEYVGSKVLGNSSSVESSDNVIDSHYVAESSEVYQSSHVYACNLMRLNSKHTFGSVSFGNGEFFIRYVGGFINKRCYESSLTSNCSDLYFSHNIHGCSEMIFSFNQRSKRNCIGNLQLPKDKYFELKKKIINELAEELKKNKKFPSLFELLPKGKPETDIKLSIPPKKEEFDMNLIDKGFASTFRIIFKKDSGSIHDYEDWLMKYASKTTDHISPFGATVPISDSPHYYSISKVASDRIVSLEEAEELGKISLPESDILDLTKLRQNIHKIGYAIVGMVEGRNQNVSKTPAVLDSMNIYQTFVANKSEHCAYSFLVPYAKYQYGCYIVFESEFCINAYNSLHLTRCFEVDSSNNCTDLLFSHNCDGLSESMFCFNTKGKRYAIGNTSLTPDKYKTVKSAVIQQVLDELDKNKNLSLDIFNIGCGKK